MSRRLPARLHIGAVAALSVLLLTSCAAGSGPSDDPAASSAEDQGATETAPETSAYSASPECDALVAARDAGFAEYDQTAVQVSPDDLPFTVDNPAAVLCTWAVYTVDDPDGRPPAFEMALVATNGVGYNSIALAEGLTYHECATADPLGCFADTAGNEVIVMDAQGGFDEYLGDEHPKIAVGIHTTSEWRDG